MRPQAVPAPVAPVENRDVTRLYEALKKIDETPNVITLEAFREYEPLFQKTPRRTEQQLKDLTTKYCDLFDLYKSTMIINNTSDRRIIITLPPVFTPVRSLSPTKTNSMLVDANTKLTGSLPLYAATAFGRMTDALIAEQAANSAVVDAYRSDYNAAVQEFMSLYGEKTDAGRPMQSAPGAVDQGPATGGASWEFEE